MTNMAMMTVHHSMFFSIEEYYKREYFEEIDIIKGELERSFFTTY